MQFSFKYNRNLRQEGRFFMQKRLARFMVALVATAFLVIPGLSFGQANPCAAKNPCAAQNPSNWY